MSNWYVTITEKQTSSVAGTPPSFGYFIHPTTLPPGTRAPIVAIPPGFRMVGEVYATRERAIAELVMFLRAEMLTCAGRGE